MKSEIRNPKSEIRIFVLVMVALSLATILVMTCPMQCDKAMAGTTVVHGPASTAVTTTDAQTLTNKTLTSPVLTTPQINDTSADHQYVFAVSELAADRNITWPLLTGDDTFVFAAFAQTLTNKTLASPVLTTPQINDTSSDHQYVFAVSELAADRNVTWPLLTGNDTLVFQAHTQTLTNKTLTSPTLTGTWNLSSCTVTLPNANVTAAKLSTSLQDSIPYLTITGTNDADGTGSATVQIKDAAGNNLEQRFLVKVWIADAEYSEPDPQTDFSVTTGEQMHQIEADAEYDVITGATGAAAMNIDAGGAKTVYVMAECNGRIVSSGAIAITVP